MTPAEIDRWLKDEADRIARSAGQHARAVRLGFARARRRLGV